MTKNGCHILNSSSDRGFCPDWIVANLRVDKDALYGELLKHYRFEDKYTWGDTQLKSQIMNDKRYIDKSKELAEQEYYYDYAKDILDTIKSNHFIVQEYNKMKNYL